MLVHSKYNNKKCVYMIVVSPAVGHINELFIDLKTGKVMLHWQPPPKIHITILWFSGSDDHFRMYRHHDNRVHILGEFKESMNLPEKRNPWAFFTLFSKLFCFKEQKPVFKSNKHN